MDVKPGYKLTELGPIPEEWEVKPLIDVVDFLDGQRRPVKDSDRARMRGDIPYYGASGIVDYVDDFLFDEDLILLAEDGENILSRNSRLAFRISGKTWVNNHAHVLRPKPEMGLDYLVEFLESRDYAQYNTGTAQPKLNKQVCSKIPVVCPTAPEQRAIAQVLRDMDALLSGLDRLIAKKRDLKQAAMQQLLTGQIRLDGFTGEWPVQRLDCLLRLQVGFPFSSAFFNEKGAGIRLIKNRDLKSDDQLFHYSGSYDESFLVDDGDLLVGMDGDFLPCRWSKGRALLNQRVGRVIPTAGLSAAFAFYMLIEPLKQIELKTSSTTVKHLAHGDVEGIEIAVPTLAEQTVIATVLSDMDAELAALEARRDKTRVLKQATMQELLTGRTRLIEPEAQATWEVEARRGAA